MKSREILSEHNRLLIRTLINGSKASNLLKLSLEAVEAAEQEIEELQERNKNLCFIINAERIGSKASISDYLKEYTEEDWNVAVRPIKLKRLKKKIDKKKENENKTD